MGNIAAWLREYETQHGEVIEAICIGQHDDDRWSLDGEFNDRTGGRIDRVRSRDEGLSILDVEYDSGFGGADCFPMYAWSASWVYFIDEYDGATGVNYIPRNPIDCAPCFGGERA